MDSGLGIVYLVLLVVNSVAFVILLSIVGLNVWWRIVVCFVMICGFRVCCLGLIDVAFLVCYIAV